MIINRCPRCEGRKEIVGLGNMRKQCGECHGVGHISKSDVKVVEGKAAEVKGEGQMGSGALVDKRTKAYKEKKKSG